MINTQNSIHSHFWDCKVPIVFKWYKSVAEFYDIHVCVELHFTMILLCSAESPLRSLSKLVYLWGLYVSKWYIVCARGDNSLRVILADPIWNTCGSRIKNIHLIINLSWFSCIAQIACSCIMYMSFLNKKTKKEKKKSIMYMTYVLLKH